MSMISHGARFSHTLNLKHSCSIFDKGWSPMHCKNIDIDSNILIKGHTVVVLNIQWSMCKSRRLHETDKL